MDAVVDFVAATLVDHNVEDELGDAITIDEVVGLEVLTPWRVIGAGSVAIWPRIAPAPTASRWEVAQPALPVEHYPNPGKKAHNVEKDEVGKSGLQVSTSCMTSRVTLTPLMMQDSCMCLWISDRLLLSLLRRKL